MKPWHWRGFMMPRVAIDHNIALQSLTFSKEV